MVAVCIGIIGFIITGLQSEIAPLEDRSSIRFTVTAAEGTSYSSMQTIADNIQIICMTLSLKEILFLPEHQPVLLIHTPTKVGTRRTKIEKTISQADIANRPPKKAEQVQRGKNIRRCRSKPLQ